MTCTYLAKRLRELSSTKTGSYPHEFLCLFCLCRLPAVSIKHRILATFNINTKKSISVMYIPCEASSRTLLHQNRKLSSRISLQNQLFCLCRLPAVIYKCMSYASTKSPQSTFIRFYGNQRNIFLTT